MTRHLLHDLSPGATRALTAALIFGVVFWAGGCSLLRGSADETAMPVPIIVTGEPDLNGGGNAALVYVYQLADDAGFRAAPHESFWQAPAELLGETLLGTNQVQLFPNASETLTVELQPGTRFLGVAANLRDPDRDNWRAVYSVEEVAQNPIQVTVGANALSAQIQ